MPVLRCCWVASATARALVFACGLACSTCFVVAEPGVGVGVGGVLHLRGGDVGTAGLPSALVGDQFSSDHHVITLDGPMSPARESALAGAGVQLEGYLPTNSFIADMSKSTPAQVRALNFVTWAGPYRKEWKVDAALAQGAMGRPFVTPERIAFANQGRVAAFIWLFKTEPAAPVQAKLAKLNKVIVTMVETIEGGVCLGVIMDAADVAALADMREVQFAEHMGEFTARSNAVTRWVMQSDVQNSTPLYDHAITGVGQIIGMIDGGLAETHCSFFDGAHPLGPTHRKIVAYNISPTRYDLHGTHVSATAAGDAGDSSDTRGIAYGAKIVFNTWPSPNEASQFDHFNLHYTQGARVHSNSWGDDSNNNYDSACRGIDSFQHQNDDNLLVFAVTDQAITIRNPENAKNSLAVSGSGEAPAENTVCVGGFAPTADGRRKPEVVAPGCSINSAAGTACATTPLTGTSMSCPAVAGAAALARQYFTDGFYPTGTRTPANSINPSGSLLKAVVVNSSVDVTGTPGYPSSREGWGRVMLDNALPFAGSLNHLLVQDVRNTAPGALTTGQSAQVHFHVGNCPLPLHVTLAYADSPALANATFTPVNNLDLVVTNPAGVTYAGNNFAAGVSAPGGTPDAINNLEQVIITNPQAGAWTVTISGTAINQGPQGYAVVITGAVDTNACGTADFNCDGDVGTDADIEAFFAALAGGPGDADFNRDGDVGTDQDIEAFFSVLAGGGC